MMVSSLLVILRGPRVAAGARTKQPRRCGRRPSRLARDLRMTGQTQASSSQSAIFARAVRSTVSKSLPRRTAGPFSLLPFATEAKGSGTPTDAGLVSAPAGAARALISCPSPFARKAFEGARSPVGVPPRLSPRGLTSPLAQLRPCFLGRGLVRVLPAFACPSPVSTSRADRSIGRHDARAGRGTGRIFPPAATAPAPHSRIPSRKASLNERDFDSLECNRTGDRCQYPSP